MNPILPPTAFIPDGEPHIFEYEGERRLFLYGSRDERVTAFCGYGHDVWSAPLDNLNQWTCHGEIFSVEQVQQAGYGIVDEQHFGAPDCVYNPVTKKYYLYTFLGAPYHLNGTEGPKKNDPQTVPGFEEYGPKCVVAQSDSPVGPFTDPVMCDWPALNSAGAFDPTALVDQQEDGSVRVYVYWGMKKGDRCAEVDPVDMHTIIDPDTRKPNRNAWRKTLPEPENLNGSTLFEASSIRKVAKKKYVFIYSANEEISALTYCYASSPFGPWRYGGRIVDNRLTWKGGNNHGSIVKVNGRWYVFYHRQTTNNYNRQAMMEPIEVAFGGDQVKIPMVEMTSQGCDVNGLEAFHRYNIGICCYKKGNAYIDGAQRCPDGMNPMVGIKSGTVVGVKYFTFGEESVAGPDRYVMKLNIQLLRDTLLTIQVCIPEDVNNGDNWIAIAECKLQDYTSIDSRYHEVVLPLTELDANRNSILVDLLRGKWALFFCFKGTGEGDLCRLKGFEFSKAKDNATSNEDVS